MLKAILAVSLLFLLTPVFAENRGDYEKLEKCLSEFYQGRPRDYPSKVKKKEILVFKSENGDVHLHIKQLRGMESVCYKMFSHEN